MTSTHDYFNPDSVDEQIEQLYQYQDYNIVSLNNLHNPAKPAEELIQDLHHLYNDDEEVVLDAVWVRLTQRMEGRLQARQEHTQATSLSTSSRPILSAKSIILREQSRHNGGPPLQHISLRYLSLIATVFVAVILVGSLLVAFQDIHNFKNSLQTASSMPALSSPTPEPTIQSAVPTSPGVYVSGLNVVYRYDVKTGNMLWRYDLPLESNATAGPNLSREVPRIITQDDTVYAGVSAGATHPSAIFALNAVTGAERWKFTQSYAGGIADLQESNGTLYASILKPDGSGTSDAIVYALNAKTGAVFKSYSIGHDARLIAVNQTTLYVNELNGPTAFDLATGKKLWQTPILSRFFSALHVVNGTLYTVGYYFNPGDTRSMQISYVYAFNTKDGKELWHTEAISAYGTDLTVANDVIYFGTRDGWLYAYKAQSGEKRWSVSIQYSIDYAVAVEKGVIYIGASSDYKFSSNNVVVALDAVTGQKIWLIKPTPLSNSYMVTPVIVDGILYVGGEAIYALQISNGLQLWQTELASTPEAGSNTSEQAFMISVVP